MAERNSTSEAPARCKGSAERDDETQQSPCYSQTASSTVRVEDIIDDERMRLMKAHSVLQCVAIAMEAEQICAADGPYWPSVIESALEMLNTSIQRLEGHHCSLKSGAADIETQA